MLVGPPTFAGETLAAKLTCLLVISIPNLAGEMQVPLNIDHISRRKPTVAKKNSVKVHFATEICIFADKAPFFYPEKVLTTLFLLEFARFPLKSYN